MVLQPRLMNGMGSMLVSSYVWVILSFAISSVLWFAMVVVIYPEQAGDGAGGMHGLTERTEECTASRREMAPMASRCTVQTECYVKVS